MPDGDRVGNWQLSFTGRRFWPLDLRPEDVCIEDVAHALAMKCRFGGHVRRFYGVGEHSVRVCHEVWLSARERGIGYVEAARLAFAGLLHDASEAYVADVPRPLKRSLVGYAEIEQRAAEAVAARFGLDPALFDHPLVKRADEVLLMTERRDLMAPSVIPWTFAQGVDAAPLPAAIEPWTWEEAERAFLVRFHTARERGVL